MLNIYDNFSIYGDKVPLSNFTLVAPLGTFAFETGKSIFAYYVKDGFIRIHHVAGTTGYVITNNSGVNMYCYKHRASVTQVYILNRYDNTKYITIFQNAVSGNRSITLIVPYLGASTDIITLQ